MLHPLRPSRVSCARPTVLALCAAGALALAPLADAADGYSSKDTANASPITDRFALRAIYFPATLHTVLRLDPNSTPLGGTTLSAEDDLGMPSKDHNGSAELMFRLRERNRIRVDYLKVARTGTTVLTRTIIFGNQIFNVNDQVQSSFDWRLMGFTYTHSFILTSRFELGAGVGVHLIDADAIGSVPARLLQHESSAAGAFPTIALDTTWRIWRGLSLNARGQYLSAAVSGLRGSLGDYHADLQYRVAAPLAVGVGYSDIRIKYETLTRNTPGLLNEEMRGPEFFVRVSF
jgi:hypothetical protein